MAFFMIVSFAFVGAADAALVAHWKLDETAGTSGAGSVVDSGQFGFDGTPTGTITFGGAGANVNTGTSANFNTGSVDVSYDGMLNPASFTLTAWARVTGGSGSYRSVVTSRDSTSPEDGYIIYAASNNNWEFWTGDGAQSGTGWHQLSGGAVTTNTWTHLAISYDATSNTKSFYINAGTPATTTAQGYESNAHEALHIGGGADTGTQYRFVGDIDDVSLWNEVLDQTEIQNIMNDSVPDQATQQLIASFDMGSDAAFNGVGPFGGPNTSATAFAKISAATSDQATQNGVTARVFNGSGYSTPNSAGSELTDDYAYQGGGGDNQANWEITGLDSNTIYDIYMVSSDGTGFGPTNIYGADYTMTDGTADQTTVRATGGTTEAFADFVDRRDYAVFTNVVPDGTGKVAGTYNLIAGQPHTGLAGIQVVNVPEPASFVLLMLGVCGLLGFSRRR